MARGANLLAAVHDFVLMAARPQPACPPPQDATLAIIKLALRRGKGAVAAEPGAAVVGRHNSEMVSSVCS